MNSGPTAAEERAISQLKRNHPNSSSAAVGGDGIRSSASLRLSTPPPPPLAPPSDTSVPPPAPMGAGRPHGPARAPQHPRDAQAIFSSVQDNAAAARDALMRAIRVNEETNETSDETLVALGRQRETIQHAVRTTAHMHDNLTFSKRIVRDMKRHVTVERLTKVGIIVFLLLVIYLIVCYRWIKTS